MSSLCIYLTLFNKMFYDPTRVFQSYDDGVLG